MFGLLAEAYADGRLNREEYDERADVAGRARTLGELPTIVADLVRQVPPRADSLARASTEELRERALRAYEASRREAFSGVVTVAAVLSVIWFVTGGGFYWPVFVILVGGANLLRVLLHKQDIVEKEQRRLERRQRKSLEPPAEA